jgi:hypothetical protein
METAVRVIPVNGEDRARFYWYGAWCAIMAVSALPLVGFRVPPVLPYVPLLVIHEFAAFFFFGHTFFSNIWSMMIRTTQPREYGVWARQFLRKLAMIVTGPMAVVVPVAGAMLTEHLGGFRNNPWAWDSYFAFWLMAGVSIVPDVIRYARNRHGDDPTHGLLNGGIRAMIATVLVFYIMWAMATKQSLIAGHLFMPA